MNVVDLLEQDHDRLREMMTAIHRSISHDDLRQAVGEFATHLELHESVEEEILFPAYDREVKQSSLKVVETDHIKMHEALWGNLDKLMDRLNTCHQVGARQAFFEFSAQAEDHFRSEERVLFPLVRRMLDENVLRQLGEEAEARFERFAGAGCGPSEASHEHR